MARSSVKIEFDDKEVRALFKKLGAEASFAAVAAAVTTGAEIVADEIRASAPDSGLPRSSRRKQKGGQSYPYKLSVDIAPKQAVVKNDRVYGMTLSLPYYAQMVERGTSKMAPRPFIRPATDRARPKAVEAVKAAIAALVARAG